MFVQVKRFSDCKLYKDRKDKPYMKRIYLKDIEYYIDRKEKIFTHVTHINTSEVDGKECIWIDTGFTAPIMVKTDKSNIKNVIV